MSSNKILKIENFNPDQLLFLEYIYKKDVDGEGNYFYNKMYCARDFSKGYFLFKKKFTAPMTASSYLHPQPKWLFFEINTSWDWLNRVLNEEVVTIKMDTAEYDVTLYEYSYLEGDNLGTVILDIDLEAEVTCTQD